MNIKTSYLLIFDIAGFAVATILFMAGMGDVGKYVFIGIIILGIAPFVLDMVKSALKGNYGLDILAVTTIAASLLLGEYPAAAVILLMLTGGEALEDYAQHKAQAELTALMKRAPQQAHLYKDGKAIDVAVSAVKVDDIILIKPGETVPVDAVVIEGVSSFDESAITGESLPVEKKAGDDLVSGSVNAEAATIAKAIHTSSGSQYQQIINLVKEAASSHSPLVRLADYYSIPFTVLSLGIAGAAWYFTGSALRGLEVLVVATPCPLLIATPVAIVAGMSRSARHGIIVKSGGAIEQLAEVKAIAFDKTGTLTKGEPSVFKIIAEGITEAEVLGLASALSHQSAHVLSQPVVNEAEFKNVIQPKVENIIEKTGNGVTAQIGTKKIMFGKLSWLILEGVKNLPEEKIHQTAAYLAVDGKYAGVIYFSDPVRPEAKTTLESLKQLGIKKILMLTGDRKDVAEAVSAELGGIEFIADCKPEDKVNAVRQMKKEFGLVAMVGDGVNDAPTLVAADVGIAIGARGSTVASESANIVIMPNDINHVVRSFQIAIRTLFIAKQSIFVGIGLSIVLMLFATSGIIKPVYGALLQEVVDVAVILNALRARKTGI